MKAKGLITHKDLELLANKLGYEKVVDAILDLGVFAWRRELDKYKLNRSKEVICPEVIKQNYRKKQNERYRKKVLSKK